jgi:hypothetical protein
MSSSAARLGRSMSRRRLAAVVVAGVAVALVALVAVGRWERRRWIDEQLRGMRLVQALVGPLDQPGLFGYRVVPQFDCLVYKYHGNPLALELCVDGSGRLIEAIDRRAAVRRYYSLQAEPGASTIRIDRSAIDRLLRKMGAPKSPS